MTIDGINPLDGVRTPRDSKVESDAKSTGKASGSDSVKPDKVDVAGGDVAAFAAQINDIPDVRSDRIEALQQEISNGTYKVPSDELAEIILGELV